MKSVAFASLLAVSLAFPVHADDTHHKESDAAAGQSSPMADGEVRKVDPDAKKITIKHGAIPNLDMPPHTMVFQVRDAAMLQQVKAGDRIRFQAEKVGGAFMVTKIEPAN